MQMSFREKTTWSSMLAMLLVYGWYFLGQLPALLDGTTDMPEIGIRLGVTIFALVLLQIIPIILFAAGSPKEAQAPADERELMFQFKGFRSGFFVLSLGALLCCVGALWFDVSRPIVAHAILFAVVLAELSKLGTQLFHYRTGL